MHLFSYLDIICCNALLIYFYMPIASIPARLPRCGRFRPIGFATAISFIPDIKSMFCETYAWCLTPHASATSRSRHATPLMAEERWYYRHAFTSRANKKQQSSTWSFLIAPLHWYLLRASLMRAFHKRAAELSPAAKWPTCLRTLSILKRE